MEDCTICAVEGEDTVRVRGRLSGGRLIAWPLTIGLRVGCTPLTRAAETMDGTSRRFAPCNMDGWWNGTEQQINGRTMRRFCSGSGSCLFGDLVTLDVGT